MEGVECSTAPLLPTATLLCSPPFVPLACCNAVLVPIAAMLPAEGKQMSWDKPAGTVCRGDDVNRSAHLHPKQLRPLTVLGAIRVA